MISVREGAWWLPFVRRHRKCVALDKKRAGIELEHGKAHDGMWALDLGKHTVVAATIGAALSIS